MYKFWNFIQRLFKRQNQDVVPKSNFKVLDEEYEGWLGI